MNEEIIEKFGLTDKNKKWINKIVVENTFEDSINKFAYEFAKMEREYFEKIPDLSKAKFYRFANPEHITPNRYVLYNYENVYIFYDRGGPSIFYEKTFEEKNISELLYILSYFYMVPCLPFSKNKEYTQKVFEMASIETIDFTEMLQIRYFKKNGLRKKITIITNNIMFKLNSKNYTEFQKLSSPTLLALYHASLFQKDIAAKCVFLFRIVDCIQREYNPTSLTFVKLIEKYYSEALKYKFQPLFVERFYYDIENGSVINNDKEIKNYFQLLKTEARKIYKELMQKHTSLDFGYIIYNAGRGSVAHGSNTRGPLSLHNFENDLLDINDVNIILELIARYAIESFNPQLKNQIEPRKEKYKKEY